MLHSGPCLVAPMSALSQANDGLLTIVVAVCTVEAPIHQNIKDQIVQAQETDTALVMRRWKNTTRLYRNKVTDEALRVERESKTGEFAEIAPFVSGQRGKQVFINGDPEYGVSCTSRIQCQALLPGGETLCKMCSVCADACLGLDCRSGYRPHPRHPDVCGAGGEN